MSSSGIQKIEGILVDAYYKDGIVLSIRDASGEKKDYSSNFRPYLYILTEKELSEEDAGTIKSGLKNLELIVRKNISSGFEDNKSNIYQLVFSNIESFISARNHLSSSQIISQKLSLYEFDIPFLHRFFLDNNLSNFKKIRFTCEGSNLLSLEAIGDSDPELLSSCAFDIEVLNSSPEVFPKPENDPVISISIVDNKKNKFVFFLADNTDSIAKADKIAKERKDNQLSISFYRNEADLINAFIFCLEKISPDIIFTYNGDGFDFEYLSKRYKRLTSKDLYIGAREIRFHKQQNKRVSIDGIVHFDVYALMKLLNYLQVFNYPKLDLKSIYSNITGKPKLALPPKEMIESYFSGNYLKIIDYNLDDVLATQELAKNYYSIPYEISKEIDVPLFDVLHSSAGVMVEKLFMKYFYNNRLLIPNKPREEEVSERYRHTFEGAFVMSPVAGLHKNIAVVDFRSYHLSLIISYNISPETIDCNCCKDTSKEETLILGHHLCHSKKGFVPTLLSSLLSLRLSIKENMKSLDKSTMEYKGLYGKQYALKILLASVYGYMGFAGARWYCRSCLDIMYYLVRTKIQETISIFEGKGYQVIYGDTDSNFLHYDDLNKLKNDLKEINNSLPSSMHLELEDTYKSGIFVMSRSKDRVAKKKYALLDSHDNMKIKGFEFVRRDWCGLVKESQKKVLEILLKEENPKQASVYIKKVIFDLQSRSVPKEKLILRSSVHKSLARYKTITPAMSAVAHAKLQGRKLSSGELIEFIITSSGVNISQKARLAEFVNDGDYDIDYYIDNQLIPAVYPLMDVFGVTKDELLTGKKQKELKDFFGGN